MSILHQLEARGEEPISSVFQVPYRWQMPVLLVVSITLVREAMGISSRMNFPPCAALTALFPCLLPAATEHICLTGAQGCPGTLAPAGSWVLAELQGWWLPRLPERRFSKQAVGTAIHTYLHTQSRCYSLYVLLSHDPQSK